MGGGPVEDEASQDRVALMSHCDGKPEERAPHLVPTLTRILGKFQYHPNLGYWPTKPIFERILLLAFNHLLSGTFYLRQNSVNDFRCRTALTVDLSLQHRFVRNVCMEFKVGEHFREMYEFGMIARI